MRRIGRLVFSASFLISLSLGEAIAAVPEQVIRIDGSSTVYPITEAVAEEFGAANRTVKVTVGISGTGGGFKKLCAGELDIADASRPIKQSEIAECAKTGVEYVELPVAYDALTVVVNPKNTWANSITVAELKKIWEPEAQGKVTRWNQVRASWPDAPLRLFGPGVDSGTYDYFTEAVVGKQHASRGDFTSSEDDNVLVQGVAGDMNALGFFGLAYFEENKDKLRAVLVDDENASNGAGAQAPTLENVKQGIYQPLARPLFIYVNKASQARAEVQQFVKAYINTAGSLSREVGYIPLPENAYRLSMKRFENKVLGSMFASQSQVGITIEEMLSRESAS